MPVASTLPGHLLPALRVQFSSAARTAYAARIRPVGAVMEKNQREALEDLLEAIWLCREAGRDFQVERHRPEGRVVSTDALLARLIAQGLVVKADGRPGLTVAGEQAAAGVVRRHRLAERLYTDLFQAAETGQQSFACRFEHILTQEVTDAVCTLLGHPPTCPHGRQIPRGECCRRSVRAVGPLVKPLSEFTPGASVRIVFITPRFHHRLDRLNSFGVLPGAVIQLHQKRPSYVIRVGATEVAIEKEIADEIYAIGIE